VTSPLDEISYRLGEVSAGNAMLLKRAEKRDSEMAEVKAMLGEIKTKMDPLVSDVVWMKPHVISYSGIRARAAVLGSMLVFATGTFGGAVGNWFLKKYGG
jgi:hypothetical protein